MGGHFMKGTFQTLEECFEAIRGARKVWEEDFHLCFEVAEIQYNRETAEYELSIYFGK